MLLDQLRTHARRHRHRNSRRRLVFIFKKPR
jgi:hypothetical protein